MSRQVPPCRSMQRSIRRIIAALLLLEAAGLTPGVVPTANAAWTYLGLAQVGISWGHIVRKHKFRCQTSKHHSFIFYSSARTLADAKKDASKRCK